MAGSIGALILMLLAATFFGLIVFFVLVPVFKGIGWLIGGVFTGIGWLVGHFYTFIAGMLADSIRFIGALIAWVVLIPLLLGNIIIGRWSAAGHFWRSMNRECGVGMTCAYRVLLQRPLRLVMLHGLLEGLEQRVNEAMVAAPTSDTPNRRTGKFDGYTIVGSLPGGGSGAKLYIAEPDKSNRKAREMPGRVVIKSFALTDGSSLPQIVRESRALEAAKQMGLVLDHRMDEHRFYYVMPYHRGEHLGIVTRQLHGRSSADGLSQSALNDVSGYAADLLRTLSRYHDGGLWHKDVKPENIIIHHDRAHLVDLGLVSQLRSAMTLTTHGTEYFRDPEMVRQALRGVKVHQVDGAKFDIYAVGAVLYFTLENTFPAHGGLSAFHRRSPEAMRWIVRRAMADYNKRYETAALMLADVDHVHNASDPYGVKPADLPSMRGVTPPPLTEPEPYVTVAVEQQQTPIPAGSDRPRRSGRPRLNVTNWWTGAYGVAGPAQGEPDRHAARTYRDESRSFREHHATIREQVRHRTVNARRAAREQIKAARERAREIRRRVQQDRRNRRFDSSAFTVRKLKQSQSPVSALVGFAVLVLMISAGFFMTARGRATARQQRALAIQSHSMTFPRVSRGRLILINNHVAKAEPESRRIIEGILADYRDDGYEISSEDRDIEALIRKSLPSGLIDPDGSLPVLALQTMAENNINGILQIVTRPGETKVHERVRAILIMP